VSADLKEGAATPALHGYVRGSKGCPLVAGIDKGSATETLCPPSAQEHIIKSKMRQHFLLQSSVCFGAHIPSEVRSEPGYFLHFVHQISRFSAYFAFSSMNSRRGSTLSPMRTEKISSHAMASSTSTFRMVLVLGSMVVSAS